MSPENRGVFQFLKEVNFLRRLALPKSVKQWSLTAPYGFSDFSQEFKKQ